MSRPVGGFRLAYDRSGDGPAVMLLHGGHGDRTDWADVAVQLDATVVVPDLRGAGESDRWPHGDISVSGQAASVVGLIDELRLGRVVLGGYGVGAAVARLVAARHPRHVAGLVMTPPPRVPARTVAGTAHDIVRRSWTSWSAPRFVPDRARLEHLALQHDRRLLEMSGDAVPPQGPEVVTVPTTVLWPQLDPLIPDAWFDRLAERFRRVRVRGLPGVGHFVPVEAPMAFVDALHAALSERKDRHES
ncbi:alpha/beta fold hydrolase [Pseudonocardia sulfidoxydans]|uniref:alpha/beta fold hydrolase n=1 Tax=Pseudonocardia sulfidoxydans TaxID=54011 RepID=UPI001FEC08D2|nr:alpha/beta hydrolase [Pseudonocardia sulfidoxydans]